MGSGMTRRTALLALLVIFGRGITGEAREANVTIDLSLLKTWKVTLGKEELVVTGEELFKALSEGRAR